MIFESSYKNFNSVWIETTEETHHHGGLGWEFGKCLWSPSGDVSGGKIYELMLQPKIGDPVIHLYLKNNIRYLYGHSIIAETCKTVKEEPPEAGKWSAREDYYKINLKEYSNFIKPLDLRIITKKYENEIRAEIKDDNPANYAFNTYLEEVRLGQGRYLTKCTEKLFVIFRESLKIEISNFDIKLENNQNSHEEYAEGQRRKREIYFFVRNPKLAEDAKKSKNYKCEACGFVFKETYGERGDKYIECHHENPLSERSEKEWNENIKTSLNDVKILCSNCHRIIHRTRPAIKFNKLLEILKKNK